LVDRKSGTYIFFSFARSHLCELKQRTIFIRADHQYSEKGFRPRELVFIFAQLIDFQLLSTLNLLRTFLYRGSQLIHIQRKQRRRRKKSNLEALLANMMETAHPSKRPPA
jgi:hypothetical protein